MGVTDLAELVAHVAQLPLGVDLQQKPVMADEGTCGRQHGAVLHGARPTVPPSRWQAGTALQSPGGGSLEFSLPLYNTLGSEGQQGDAEGSLLLCNKPASDSAGELAEA